MTYYLGLDEERLSCLSRNGISLESVFNRLDMTILEREASARLECELYGLDPDAPHVDDNEKTTICSAQGDLFPNYEYYDLVLFGFGERFGQLKLTDQ